MGLAQLGGLPQKEKAWLQSPVLSGVSVGYQLHDIAQNTPISIHKSDGLFTPASTLKVLTSLALWEQFGGDYVYETKIGYTGQILPDGTLDGHLLVLSSGDPSLASEWGRSDRNLDRLINGLVDAALRAGIRCVEGTVLFQGVGFDDAYLGPSWNAKDIGNYYAAGIYDFNVQDNSYTLEFDTRGKLGEKAKFLGSIQPLSGLSWESEVVIAGEGSGDQAYIEGGPDRLAMRITGTLPKGHESFTIKGALPNPARFFVQQLSTRMESMGIPMIGNSIELTEMSGLLKTWKSPPLDTLVFKALSHSINLYCEGFLKTLAPEIPKSRTAGVAQIEKILAKHGLKDLDLKVVDGSGLSKLNRLSPRLLASYQSLLVQKYGEEAILGIFPRAGVDGTVKKMMRSGPTKGKVWIKSGSISGVLCYSGYLRNKKGNLLSFTIFCNNIAGSTAPVRTHIEQLLTLWYEQT